MADAQETTTTSPVPTMTKRKSLHRSCLLCHQRKIRCDRKSPCRNCSRADVLCYYPSPEQNVRRPQKKTIADVSARLVRLERTISALTNGSATTQDITPPRPPATDEINSNDPDGSFVVGVSSEEKLVQGDSSSRYFNDALLSQVIEEVCIIRLQITVPDMYHRNKKLRS